MFNSCVPHKPSLLFWSSSFPCLMVLLRMPGARVAFCSCVYTLRCALVKVSCFSMYYWVTLPKLMGQKTFQKSKSTTYLLQRLTWDIQGRTRYGRKQSFCMPDLIIYRVELYQENWLTLETTLSLLFSIVAVSLPQKMVFLLAKKRCRSL